VLADLLFYGRRQFAVEILIQVLRAFATVHFGVPLMYPIPTA
jgi:hypothetical protein